MEEKAANREPEGQLDQKCPRPKGQPNRTWRGTVRQGAWRGTPQPPLCLRELSPRNGLDVAEGPVAPVDVPGLHDEVTLGGVRDLGQDARHGQGHGLDPVGLHPAGRRAVRAALQAHEDVEALQRGAPGLGLGDVPLEGNALGVLQLPCAERQLLGREGASVAVQGLRLQADLRQGREVGNVFGNLGEQRFRLASQAGAQPPPWPCRSTLPWRSMGF